MNAFTLWNTFQHNVNPLSKVIYLPKVQNLVLDSIRDPYSISTSSTALLFSIYATAVLSLKDDDCQIKFGESRNILLERYTNAAQQALGAANFIQSTDLEVLQAFVLYIIAMRPTLVPETTWILSGMAIRMSERISLLTPKNQISLFEAQMRSRIGWHILWIGKYPTQIK
jgi:hypothetical protein